MKCKHKFEEEILFVGNNIQVVNLKCKRCKKSKTKLYYERQNKEKRQNNKNR